MRISCRTAPGSMLVALFIAACTLTAGANEPPPPQGVGPPTADGPDTRVYAYARQGQSDQQLDRDRYECHMWAVKQTGFDPSGPNVPPHQRVVVVRESPPPGASVAAGALTGAAIGAAVSRPRDAGSGAIVGAVAGAAIGAIAASGQPRRTEKVIQSERDRDIERGALNYRRALSACLEGRGYSVR